MAEDQDDRAAEALAQRARLWWEAEAERALRDLQLYPVQIEEIGHTTTQPNGETW